MLVVKVELHKHGAEVVELARMVIANVGGTKQFANYAVRVGGPHQTIAQIYDRPEAFGSVFGHARLKENVWSLVLKACGSVRLP